MPRRRASRLVDYSYLNCLSVKQAKEVVRMQTALAICLIFGYTLGDRKTRALIRKTFK